MANNRMVLLCNVCVPKGTEWRYHTKGVLPIAKWYPQSTYANHSNFDDFLAEHDHAELPSEGYTKGAGQPNPVRMVYESVDMPIIEPNK